MPVYLIRAGETGPVKIGMAQSIRDAIGRMDSLQVAHWEVLRLLRMWKGDRREEELLHVRFADLRIRGEWFSFSRLMLSDVGLEIIDLGTDVDAPMSVKDMIRLVGGAGDTARLCGTSVAAVSRWIWHNEIPADKRPPILSRARERGITGITTATFERMQPSGRPPRVWRSWETRKPIIPVASLADREAHWVSLREEKQTFGDIAKAYGVSPQRVHRVLARILASRHIAA